MRRGLVGGFEVGELNKIKREIALPEMSAPRGDQGREQRAVFAGAVGVALALVPKRAPQCVGEKRVDHAVEKTGRRPRVARPARGAGARVGFKKSGVRGERRRLGLGFGDGRGRGFRGGFGGEPRGAVGVVLGFFRGIVRDVFGPTLADAGEAGRTRERGWTEPSFHRRAADGAVNDADRNVEFLK